MTYLDVLNELRKLPVYLLEDEVELWRYSPTGDIETMPVHHIVSPHDEDDPEWNEGGAYHLSLQSFEDEPEPPKKKFYVNVSMGMSTSFCIEAEDKYDAMDKAEHLMWSRPFFDALIENIDFGDKGSLDMLYDSMRVVDVDECTDPDVDPLYVDGFLK